MAHTEESEDQQTSATSPAVVQRSDSLGATVVPAPSSPLDPNRALGLFSRGGVVLAGARVGGRGAWLAFQVVAARLLTVSDYGVFALFWALLRVGGVFGTLGLDQGVLRYGSAARIGRTRLTILAPVLSVGLAGLLSAVILEVGQRLATGVFASAKFVGVGGLLIVSVMALAGGRTVAAVSRLAKRPWTTAMVEDFVPPVIALSALFLLPVDDATTRVIAAVAVGMGVAFLTGVVTTPFRPRGEPRSQRLATVLGYSLLASTASVFVLLSFWMDRLMLGGLSTAEAVGLYQAASVVAVVPAVVLSGIGTMVAPFIAEATGGPQGQDRAAEYYTRSIEDSLILSGLPIVIASTMPSETLEVLFGLDYGAAWGVLVVLIIAQLANAASGPVGPTLVMMGRANYWARIAALGLTVNVVLALLLIPRLGALGAATSTGVAIALLSCSGFVAVRRSVGVPIWSRSATRALVTVLVAVAFGWTVRAVFRGNDVEAFLGVLTASIVFVSAARPFRRAIEALR